MGRRAVPIFWRAYDQTVLKGRMKRYELAVIKRAFKLMFQYVAPPRVRLTADRGFADAALFAWLDTLGIRYIIRVKGSVKVELDGQWSKLNTLRFVGNARRRNLGHIGPPAAITGFFTVRRVPRIMLWTVFAIFFSKNN